MRKETFSEPFNHHWNGLYKIGGSSAFIIAILLIGEVLVYSLVPNPGSTLGYLDLFLEHPLQGLLHFDLLGMFSYLIFIPLIMALYMMLRQKNEAVMLIATVLFFVGIAVFFASNTNFSMLSLSKQYAIAISETERAMLLASLHSMVTLFKVQAFMLSYVIVSLAWLLIGIVMLQTDQFSKFTAYMGILAGASGIIAEVLENTFTSLIGLAIAFYFFALAALLIWVLLLGRKLLKN